MLQNYNTCLLKNKYIYYYFIKGIPEKEVYKPTITFICGKTNILDLGVLAIIFSVWIHNILVALDIAYAILSGAIFVPLIIGLYWKRVTSKVAFYSIIASSIVIFISFIIFGITFTLPIIFGLVTGMDVIIGLTLIIPETNIKLGKKNYENL